MDLSATIQLLFMVIFVFGFVNTAIYLASVRKFFKYLAAGHPDTSQALTAIVGGTMTGSPFKSNGAIWRYFKNQEYTSLNDPELNRIGNKVRRLLLLSTIFFVVLLILFVMTFTTSQAGY